MFQRIFKGHLIVVVTAILLLTVTLTFLMENLLYKQKTNDLQQLANPIAKQYQVANNPRTYLKQVQQLLAPSQISVQVLTGYQNLPASVKKALKNGKTVAGQRPLLKRKATWVVIPLANNKVLYMSSPIEGQAKAVKQMRFMLLVTAMIALIISSILSGTFARLASKRIKRLRQASAQVAMGNFQTDFPEPTGRGDELDQLTFDFRQMAGKIEAQQLEVQRFEHNRQQFLMDLSHELRTPLTSIRGWLEALQKGYVSDEDRNRIYTNLELETQRLIRLIQELMDLEKLRAGKVQLQPETFSVEEMCFLIRDQFLPLLQDKQVQLQMDIMPEMEIRADYDRFYQVLVNLIKNALQFTNQGDIIIGAKEDRNGSLIWVEDTGVGMTAEELSNIWNRFYKADPSRERSTGESGLGLAIAKQLVEAHYGNIEVTSTPGKGTRFTISIPQFI